MARTSTEIQQEISQWQNTLNASSGSAGSYDTECTELQERINCLTQRRQALYNTAVELGLMCGALTSAALLAEEKNVMSGECKIYLADQIVQCRTHTEGIINGAVDILNIQLGILNQNYATAFENARIAHGRADAAEQKLIGLRKELQEAADSGE